MCNHCNFKRSPIGYTMATAVMPCPGGLAIVLCIRRLIRDAAAGSGGIQTGRVRHRRKHQREDNTQQYKEALHSRPYNIKRDIMQKFKRRNGWPAHSSATTCLHLSVHVELKVVGGDTLGVVGDAGLIPNVAIRDNHLELTIAAHFETYGRNQIAVNAQGKPVHIIKRTNHNQTLVNALVKSYRWNRMLDRGKTSITELAAEAGLGRTYVSRIVSLTLLAPDIVTAIMSGTQPATLQLQDLMENLPIEWDQQRETLSFNTTARAI